jgi:hypothetical protein
MILKRLKLGTGALVMLLSFLATADEAVNVSDVPYDMAFESVFQLDNSTVENQSLLTEAEQQTLEILEENSDNETNEAPEIKYRNDENQSKEISVPKRGSGQYRHQKRERGEYHDIQPYYSNRSKFPWKKLVHNVLRPVLYFKTNPVSSVTCTARDRRGFNYKVVEYGYNSRMSQSEIRNLQDAALNKCAYESRGSNCVLVGCSVDYRR